MRSRLHRIKDWETLARNAQFRVGALAQLVGLSPRGLELFFAKHFGQSPRSWIMQMKRREAQRLRSNGESSKAIAYQLGYAHPANFSRAIRNVLPRRVG